MKHLPRRNFVIMGIARSGTSLACSLISDCVENAYCLNETESNFKKVPDLLAETREKLVMKLPVPNRWRGEVLSTDTVRVKAPIQERVAAGDYDHNAVVGVKMIQDYDSAIEAECFTIAMLRNPVYTIASWNQSGDIAWGHVMDHDMDPIWKHRGVKFKGKTKLERQCELWEFHAQMILDAERDAPLTTEVWQYEGLVSDPDEHLDDFAARFGLRYRTVERFENLNNPDRFDGIDAIAEMVEKHCPTRKEFGY